MTTSKTSHIWRLALRSSVALGLAVFAWPLAASAGFQDHRDCGSFAIVYYAETYTANSQLYQKGCYRASVNTTKGSIRAEKNWYDIQWGTKIASKGMCDNILGKAPGLDCKNFCYQTCAGVTVGSTGPGKKPTGGSGHPGGGTAGGTSGNPPGTGGTAGTGGTPGGTGGNPPGAGGTAGTGGTPDGTGGNPPGTGGGTAGTGGTPPGGTGGNPPGTGGGTAGTGGTPPGAGQTAGGGADPKEKRFDYEAESKVLEDRKTGQTMTADGKGKISYTDGDGKAIKQGRGDQKDGVTGNDPCKYSAKMSEADRRYNCKTTENTVQVAAATNQVLQAAGGLVQQTAGSQVMQGISAGGGKMSSYYEGVAKTAKTAAWTNTGIAATNAVMAALQFKKQRHHSQNVKMMDSVGGEAMVDRGQAGKATDGHYIETAGSTSANQIISKFNVNNLDSVRQAEELKKYKDAQDAIAKAPKYTAGDWQKANEMRAQLEKQYIENKKKDVATQTEGYAASISNEQAQMKAKASLGAFQSTMVALQTGVAARNAFKQAKDAEALAARMKAVENYSLPYIVQPSPGPNTTVDNTTTTPQPGLGDSTSPEVAEAGAEDDKANPEQPIGGFAPPTNYGDADNKITPGMAGAFKPGAPSGGGGGGGGGSLGGGGGGAPAAPKDEEGKPTYANGFEGKDKYESSGIMVGGSKSGGAAPKESNLDLNGLLAQFLPKEEEQGPKNGILEYGAEGGGPGRGLASEGSYLDKNADIFERIHQTYQEKQGRGQVGI